MSRGPSLDIGHGDTRREATHLARLADRNTADLVAKLLEQLGNQGVVSQSREFIGRLDLHTFMVDDKPIELVLNGPSFKHQRLDPRCGQGNGSLSPGVGFFDGARQWTLGTG